MAKSLAVEGTVFWLVVGAILIAAPFDPAELVLSISGFVTAAIYLGVAYASWKLKRWAFIAAIVLALFTIIGSVAFGFLDGITNTFEVLALSGWLILPQFLLIFYSLRAYRESRTGGVDSAVAPS